MAGLAAAHRLRTLGGDKLDVMLLERSARLGGKINTGTLAGQTVETGAETFLIREDGADSAVLLLVRCLGLADRVVHPAAVPAAIAIGGALRPIPTGTLLGVPADPATSDGIARATGQDVDNGQPLLAPGEDIAVGALVRARYGDQVVDRLVDPMLGGVYAGRPDRLSLAATMPGLHGTAQREHTLSRAVTAALAAAARPAGQPVFASVRGGLSTLVERIARQAGAGVRLNTTVRRLARTGKRWVLTVSSARDAEQVEADAVVLAVPAAPAGRLLDSTEVSALEYASIALVTLALPPGTPLPALTGFLVPACEGYAVKAATIFGTKWTVRSGPALIRASIGRHGEEHLLQRDDLALTALARAELAVLLGGALPEPVASAVYRWGGGLPQYGVGHVDRVARIRSALPATLAVAGAAYDGVGIAACVRSGQAAADAVWRGLGEWAT